MLIFSARKFDQIGWAVVRIHLDIETGDFIEGQIVTPCNSEDEAQRLADEMDLA